MASEDTVGNASHGTGNATHMILTTALGRWLNVAEIEALLDPSITALTLSTSPPSSPPPSGSLFLYNRSVTRNYKDDGYKWIKKRNSHKVREDHVKLRVGGKFRVSGCYVHGSEVSSLHRRAYHLLNPETGTALYPVGNSNNRNIMPSLVLVHYLDTKAASQITANLMNHKNFSSNNSSRKKVSSYKGKIATSSDIFNNTSFENATPIQVHSSDISYRNSLPMTVHSSCTSQNGNLNTSSPDISNSSLINPSEMHESAGLGLETLDFLWDVIFTEGEDRLEQTIADGNISVNPSMIQEMIVVKEEEQETCENRTGVLSNQTYIQNSTHDSCVEDPSHPLGGEVIAEIVDVTPNMAVANCLTNIIISCNEPISDLGCDRCENQNGESSLFSWYTLAAFVSVTEENKNSNPRAISVDLFKAKSLNPYTYKSELSSMSQQENRHIIIVAVFLDSQTDPLCKGVAASIGHVLEQSWSAQRKSSEKSSKPWLHLSSSSHPVVKDRPFIRFLTQMSEDPFRFMAPKIEQNIDDAPHIMEPINFLPAPPSHMAMVATALSDFPNPPVKAVLPPLTTMSFTGPNDTQETKPLCEITDESPETKRIIQASMEAAVDENDYRSKKRSNSSIEIGPSAVVDVPVAASAWASKPSLVPEIDTKADEVDRHCKIRFVERLTHVIAEAEPSATLVTNNKVTNMDDQELDGILDGLLVRIVESLYEIGSDVKEELNVGDKSGFALLHYAALYNLPSLIPVLLSRGANPDIQTSRGNLTPLHLACGAGNTKIVELLVGNGCALTLPDSFGSYPVDHAKRNGFTAVAEFLQAQINDNALKSANSLEFTNRVEKTITPASNSSDGYEQEKFLVQSAFANLSLKDKLIFNMIVRKRRRGGSPKKDNSLTIPEGEDEEDDSSVNPNATNGNDNTTFDSNGDVQMRSCEIDMAGGKSAKNLRRLRQDKSEKGEEDSVDSVISNSDQESLDIAMKLMNTEELEDIHRKSTDDDIDLREWMMKRNYESLMEAKQHLQKTLIEHEKTGKSCVNAAAHENAATVRSLKNMTSQALAGLVIRKNVTKRKNSLEQKQRVVKNEPE